MLALAVFWPFLGNKERELSLRRRVNLGSRKNEKEYFF